MAQVSSAKTQPMEQKLKGECDKSVKNFYSQFFSMYYIIVYTATCCSSSKYEMLTKTNLNIKKVYTRSVKIGTVLMFL